MQPAAAVLGERDQEPGLCIRHLQVQHRRLVSVSGGTDVHGLLFDVRTQTEQRLAVQQTALRQGHSAVPQVGRKVRIGGIFQLLLITSFYFYSTPSICRFSAWLSGQHVGF